MNITDIREVWPEWEIEEKPLGRGSYGVVYKAVRRDHEVESFAAIKVISIPQDESEIDSLIAEGMSKDLTKTYLEGVVNDFVSEIQLMESFKGNTNIVSVEDYKVIERKDEVGWDIFIRMELLTPFSSYISDKTFSEEEVVKLGSDICSALELCAERNVIHRDIKPQNIFVNQFGHFKLGDFGIARKLESVTGGLSQKGSPNYMAPEVARGTQYDATVDLYSLGIVLYQLLNKNRLPFLDTERQLVNPNERAGALNRRLNGEPLSAPCDASPAMASIILCACNPDPKKRFASAKAMRIALSEATNGATTAGSPKEEELNKTMSVRHATPAQNLDQTVSSFNNPQNQQQHQRVVETFGENKKSKTPIIIAVAVAVVLLIGGSIFALTRSSGTSEEETVATEESVETAEASALTATADKAEETKESSDSKEEQVVEDPQLQAKEQTLEEAEKFAKSGDYVSAIKTIEKGQQTTGEDEEYSKALNIYINNYKTEVIADADKLADGGDYPGAIKKIEVAKTVIGEDSELDQKSTSYENTYVLQIVADVDVLIVEEKYDEASEKLAPATKLFPENSSLKDETDKLKKSQPVYLFDAEPYRIENYECYMRNDDFSTMVRRTIDGYKEGESALTSGSIKYTKGMSVAPIYNEDLEKEKACRIYYNLNAEYSSLTGKVGLSDLILDAAKDPFTINIYLDSELVESYEINKGDLPKDVELDVTGHKQIIIEIVGTKIWTYFRWPSVNLIDFVLQY